MTSSSVRCWCVCARGACVVFVCLALCLVFACSVLVGLFRVCLVSYLYLYLYLYLYAVAPRGE